MTKSECYNYDWFLDWLKRSIIPNFIPQLTLSAEHIAKNFTRLYFTVDEELGCFSSSRTRLRLQIYRW